MAAHRLIPYYRSIFCASKNINLVHRSASVFANSTGFVLQKQVSGNGLNNVSGRISVCDTNISPLAVPCRHFTSDPKQNLDYDQFLALVKSGDVQLFDVREPAECERGMIPGAINIPMNKFAQALYLTPEKFKETYGVDKPRKDDDNIVIHCQAGVRSFGALAMADIIGFKNCRHFPGGWAEWQERQNQ